MTIETSKEISAKILKASDLVKILNELILSEPDEQSRIAKAKGLEPVVLLVEINAATLAIINKHDNRLEKLELITKPIKDAQTTSNTLRSIAKSLPWLAAIGASAGWLHSIFIGTPK